MSLATRLPLRRFATAFLILASVGATARAALGERARAYVERHFSLERMVGATLEVYADLLAGRTARPSG